MILSNEFKKFHIPEIQVKQKMKSISFSLLELLPQIVCHFGTTTTHTLESTAFLFVTIVINHTDECLQKSSV